MALGGFFNKLKQGLSRSTHKISEGLTTVFKKRRLDDEALEELEELLIGADLGTAVAARVIEDFRRTRFGAEVTDEEIRAQLSAEIAKILAPVAHPLAIDPRSSRMSCWWSASTATARRRRSARWRSSTPKAACVR